MMFGMKIIGEMDRDDLITEILHYQREQLVGHELAALKGLVVDFRVNETRKALEKEAGITVQQGIFGSMVKEDDE